MPYFPDSFMPARVKQESTDVDGNQFIVGGADCNRHDSEIRSIERVVGFSGACSIAGTLHGVSQKLEEIRDNYILTTSGVVACKDESGFAVTAGHGLIPFPSTWPITTLQDNVLDDSTTDTAILDPIPSVMIAGVATLPPEGYITIINDVSFGDAIVPTQDMTGTPENVFIPSVAYGKVGQDFNFISIPNVALSSTDDLPPGLNFVNGNIVGKPTQSTPSGQPVIATLKTSKKSNQTQAVSFFIASANTPVITNSTLSVTTAAGSIFTYNITTTGFPSQILVTSLPAGLFLFGSTIQGTPTTAGTTSVVITVIDNFGGFDQKSLSITVTGNVAGNAAPTISSITPALASSTGGNLITINGTGFLASPRIFFGQFPNFVEGLSETLVSSTQITVAYPPGILLSTPLIDVIVENTDLKVAISSQAISQTAQGNTVIESVEFTSLIDDSTSPIYGFSGAKQTVSNRTDRLFGLGTNVEVLFYSGIDIPNNKILNVYRKQFGTTSTRHSVQDLVFIGIASFHVSPFMYRASGNIADVGCVLRSNGRIDMHVSKNNISANLPSDQAAIFGFSGNINFVDDTTEAFASYQATLIKNIALLPPQDC